MFAKRYSKILFQSFGKVDSTRVGAGSNPAVCNLIATDNHDLVFGVHQNCDPPSVTSPQPRNRFCSAYDEAEFLPKVYYET